MYSCLTPQTEIHLLDYHKLLNWTKCTSNRMIALITFSSQLHPNKKHLLLILWALQLGTWSFWLVLHWCWEWTAPLPRHQALVDCRWSGWGISVHSCHTLSLEKCPQLQSIKTKINYTTTGNTRFHLTTNYSTTCLNTIYFSQHMNIWHRNNHTL